MDLTRIGMIHFLKKEDFLIGVSIDDPKDLNDFNRIYKESLSGSYDNLSRGWSLTRSFAYAGTQAALFF